MSLVLRLDNFKTPYTNVPARQSKVVRLKKDRYTRGYYRMEGVRGYEFFYLKKPIQVTSLQVKYPNGKWRTLMVDDPLHWFGMEELAYLAKPGRVLVAGLGLGLILYHLVKRSDITSIKVVEIDPEIIKFIAPYIPKDDRIEIERNNYFSYILRSSDIYDTVIIDLWVLSGEDSEEKKKWVGTSMKVAHDLAKFKLPEAKVLVWGVRGYMEKK